MDNCQVVKRKPAFDLLKVLAMLGIVAFHHFGNKTPNHFVELTAGFTADTYFYDFINNIPGAVAKLSLLMDFCYGHFGNGCNYIFMLISGYFLFGRELPFPKRVGKVGKILYAILFHGIVLTVIHFLLLKNLYPFSSFEGFRPLFTLPNWFSGSNVWYLQAYGIFLLVILPLLKLFESKLTQKLHLCLAFALIFANLLAYSQYLPNIWISTKMLEFTMCYYLGGYIAKYKVRVGWKKLLPALGIYLAAYFAYAYYWRYANAIEYEPSMYSYIPVVQPFICCIIFAILCFLIFNNIVISSDTPSKILENLSSSTMGIYIFHYNFISISFILADTFWWRDWSRKGFFLFVIMNSLILFAAGFLIDKIRQWTFKRVETGIRKMLPKIQANDE